MEDPRSPRLERTQNRRGFAMPVVMFALVILRRGGAPVQHLCTSKAHFVGAIAEQFGQFHCLAHGLIIRNSIPDRHDSPAGAQQ